MTEEIVNNIDDNISEIYDSMRKISHSRLVELSLIASEVLDEHGLDVSVDITRPENIILIAMLVDGTNWWEGREVDLGEVRFGLES